MPTITAYTQVADGQQHNEDWYSVSDELIVVLDGATIRTDTGCVHSLPWYVRHLGQALVTGDAPDLSDLLAEAIRSVSARHEDTCDLTHPGTPSAAVGIVRIGPNTVDYASLGDITIMVETPAGLIVTTDDRVSHTGVDLRRACHRYLIGTPEKMDAILAMKQVELASRNRLGGYWIAAGDPLAAEHAYLGSIARNDVLAIGVCSDGAMRALELTSLSSAEGVFAVLRSGPKKLVDLVRNAERNDPLGRRHPRNKATDDATAVFADMHVSPTVTTMSGDERLLAIQSVTDTTDGLFGALPTSTGRVL